MSPDLDLEPLSEAEEVANLRGLGFTEDEIERAIKNGAAIEYPYLNAGFSLSSNLSAVWDQLKNSGAKEPSVILAPHSLDPEEKRRIGYPLTSDEKEEILRRLFAREEQYLRDNPISAEERERIRREAVTALKTIMFPATEEERQVILKDIEAAKNHKATAR